MYNIIIHYIIKFVNVIIYIQIAWVCDNNLHTSVCVIISEVYRRNVSFGGCNLQFGGHLYWSSVQLWYLLFCVPALWCSSVQASSTGKDYGQTYGVVCPWETLVLLCLEVCTMKTELEALYNWVFMFSLALSSAWEMCVLIVVRVVVGLLL